jgi:hypothetical protein
MRRPWTVSESASLLAIWGLLPRLQPACLMLANTPEDVARSTTISMPVREDMPTSVGQTIKRFAEEHCIEAEVDCRPGRLVVRLSRPANGGTSVEDPS